MDGIFDFAAALLAAGTFIYLVIALLKPEAFQ